MVCSGTTDLLGVTLPLLEHLETVPCREQGVVGAGLWPQEGQGGLPGASAGAPGSSTVPRAAESRVLRGWSFSHLLG